MDFDEGKALEQAKSILMPISLLEASLRSRKYKVTREDFIEYLGDVLILVEGILSEMGVTPEEAKAAWLESLENLKT